MTEQIPLRANEKIIFDLRSIYGSYGYSHYKMSKFEEYDLYSKNKDFLVSDGVITFTDTNGKLMALKPDVTLSIVKNTSGSGEGVQKLYYNENVYRVSKGTKTFKEIMQVGLECIGRVDSFCICEVLTLAAKSLKCISKNCVLDISHLGILSQVIERSGIPDEAKHEIIRFIGEKNIHELTAECRRLEVPEKNIEVLRSLAHLHGSPEDILPALAEDLRGYADAELIDDFACLIRSMGESAGIVNIDFSVVDDLHYYNGIVFKGFIEGIPGSVLSGGQYDTLMKKMKHSGNAIGFAVYLDMLEQLGGESAKYDADILLIYDDSSSLAQIASAAETLRDSGGEVLALNSVPEGFKCRKIYNIKNGEVTQSGYDA